MISGASPWRWPLWNAAALFCLAVALPYAADAQEVQERVRAAQRALQEKGYDIGFIDGIMGPRTKAALEEFQRKSGLAITGIVDPATLGALVPADPKPTTVPPLAIPQSSPPPPAYDYPPARSTQPSPPPPTQTPPTPPSTQSASSNGNGSIWIIVLALVAAGVVLWRRRGKASRSSMSPSPQAEKSSASPRPSAWASLQPERSDHAPTRQSTERQTPHRGDDDVIVTLSIAPEARSPSRAFSIPAPLSQKEQRERCWVRAGRSLTIAGYELRGGLLYVGKELNRQNSTGVENCLIDPSLPVEEPGPMPPDVPYYPSYRALEPRARGGYLHWLADGRGNPDAEIGYVFLYFYGLERRLILDGSLDEHDSLIAEVERLHRVYHKNYSVNRYARLFLDTARLLKPDRRFHEEEPPDPQQDYELPLSVRLAIGQLLAEGRSVPWQWMYAWTLNDPQTSLRTVHRRAEKELKELFRIRFGEKHPDGFRLSAPKARLKWTYRAASGSFVVDLDARLGGLPDIVNLTGATNKMRTILDACAEELEGYSRFLGRRPDGRGSLQALSLLPRELAHASTGGEVARLRDWLDTQLDNGPAFISGSELVARLAAGASYGKASIRSFIDTLGTFGVAVMPNPRVSLQLPKADQPFVLYRCDREEIPESEVPAFRLASLALTFGAFVAHADSALSPEEGKRLAAFAEAAPGLGERGRLDLGAHLRWLQVVPAEPGALRAKLGTLSAEDRHRLGLVALSAASADTSVHPEEIKALQRIYKVLGLNEGSVLSDLHSALATPAASGLTAIQIAPASAAGYSIPLDPTRRTAPGDIQLDPERLKHIGESTRRVSEVLSKVFTEEDEAPGEERQAGAIADIAAISAPETEQTTAFEGLDLRFKGFLSELLTRAAWSRPELDLLARSRALMTDGALEAINEWAFEHYGDALVEDGDPVTIQQHLVGFASSVDHVQSQSHQAP